MTSRLRKRWQPRFGVRTLFVLVLVVAAFFGSWPWLEERAAADVDLEAELRFAAETAIADRFRFAPFSIDALEVNTTTAAPYL